MRKREIISRIKIIDAGYDFLLDACYVCDKTKPVTRVWCSREDLYERKACEECIKKYAIATDFRSFSALWKLKSYVAQTVQMRKKLDELCTLHPSNRFYLLLRELLRFSTPSKLMLEGISKLRSGEVPSKSEYAALTGIIKRYRDARTGKTFRWKRPIRGRSKISDPLYTGSGSCGLFKN